MNEASVPDSLAVSTALASNSLIAAAFILGGLLLGLILERAVLKWLHGVALKTSFAADDVIVPAFRGLMMFWGIAAGLYGALRVTADSGLLLQWLRIALIVALVGSFTVLGARIVAGFLRLAATRESSFLPRTSLVPNLAQVLVYLLGLLVILNSLGISIAPVLTALGVGGLAIALALQDTLSNLFAGIYLLASRQIRAGDFVRLETEEEGYVVDVAWRATSLRTINDNLVVVPNSKLASAIVTNYAMPRAPHLLPVSLGASYDSDLDEIERVTREVAADVVLRVHHLPADATLDPAPGFRYHTFGEFSINFTVLLPVREYTEGLELRSAFIKALVARFRDEGLRLPFPIREFEMEVGAGGETLLERTRASEPGATPEPQRDR